MSTPDPRPPRFLAAASGQNATPVSFRQLGGPPPPGLGYSRRMEAEAASEPTSSAATFAPLHGAQVPPAAVAPPPAPVVAPAAAVAPRAPPEPDYPAIIRAVEALRSQGERLASEARSDALEIGFQVARRILEMELASGPEPLFALIRSALRKAGEARSVKVRLSPEDLVRVESAGGGGQLSGFSMLKVELLADPSLTRGDCLVETELGSVDGRLSTRLEEVKRGVSDVLLHGDHEGEAA